MKYRVLSKEIFCSNEYSLVPIRHQDRYTIMNWRNEQIYHLRQQNPLTEVDQDKYFDEVISGLFHKKYPDQLLFSYLKEEKCIGYGGLVHINWMDRNAEISFIMDTLLERDHFEFHWSIYLSLIEEIGFDQLKFHKLFTYAFDLRPHLYEVLETHNYLQEARLNEHVFFNNSYIDVLIHSKIVNDD